MSQGPTQLPDPLDLLSSVSIVFPCSLSCFAFVLFAGSMQETGVGFCENIKESTGLARPGIEESVNSNRLSSFTPSHATRRQDPEAR